ncbi:MAG: peptidylprolyl isomerase [Treponema sp.]|jgi:FKBP-type peptidyl-prolyl cis-trans isomerase SlyD|nr:peptidylprolyl isomerase [Treponema sp.]
MTITKNRVVSIDYTLTDDNNNLIDSTAGSGPLDYLHGFENIISGLENALEGRSEGDSFSVNIPAAKAYGEYDERLVTEMSLESFRGIENLEEGMRFQAQSAEGACLVTVTKIEGGAVTVDGNHPLAGMNLNFDLSVTAVREASGEELSCGHVHGGGCDYGRCGGCDVPNDFCGKACGAH